MSRQLKLGAFLMATGHHVAAWRHPEVPANAGLDFAHYKHLAQVAEAAKFDALFVADSIAAATGEVASRMARSDHFEPLTLLSALSAGSPLRRPRRLEPGDLGQRRRSAELRPR
jgi:alkanesulfonate monooxygenase SsuD/methylene tetrahydromethanopterin reductase-like flavin-dependent oxidoreductase (luciferase family)